MPHEFFNFQYGMEASLTGVLPKGIHVFAPSLGKGIPCSAWSVGAVAINLHIPSSYTAAPHAGSFQVPEPTFEAHAAQHASKDEAVCESHHFRPDHSVLQYATKELFDGCSTQRAGGGCVPYPTRALAWSTW